MIATITMPRLLYIGGGAVAEVTTALAKLGAARPLIVTDRFMESSGLLAKVTDRLDAAGPAWRAFPAPRPGPHTQRGARRGAVPKTPPSPLPSAPARDRPSRPPH